MGPRATKKSENSGISDREDAASLRRQDSNPLAGQGRAKRRAYAIETMVGLGPDSADDETNEETTSASAVAMAVLDFIRPREDEMVYNFNLAIDLNPAYGDRRAREFAGRN